MLSSPARALFKALLWRLRDVPDAARAERLRDRLRAAFRAGPPAADEAAHAAALQRGAAVAAELEATLALAKYRALRDRR
jgi:hypothetical protein